MSSDFTPFFSILPLEAAFGNWLLGVAVLLVLGALIGMISAFFGIGGGFAITPFLHSVINLPATFAVATAMGQIPFLSFSGVLIYAKAGEIRYRQGLWLIAGALPGAQIMAYLLGLVSDSEWASRGRLDESNSFADLLLLIIFSCMIGLMGSYNLKRSFQFNRKKQTLFFQSRLSQDIATVALGFLLGLAAALLGMGGGFFAVPFFVYLCGFRPVEAVATSLFAALIISSTTTLHYILANQIYFALSLAIGCGALLGARLGARSAIRAKPQILLRLLGALQFSVALFYLLSRLFSL